MLTAKSFEGYCFENLMAALTKKLIDACMGENKNEPKSR
jgi:hypothetical protein